jgi:hypothetical protein
VTVRRSDLKMGTYHISLITNERNNVSNFYELEQI